MWQHLDKPKQITKPHKKEKRNQSKERIRLYCGTDRIFSKCRSPRRLTIGSINRGSTFRAQAHFLIDMTAAESAAIQQRFNTINSIIYVLGYKKNSQSLHIYSTQVNLAHR